MFKPSSQGWGCHPPKNHVILPESHVSPKRQRLFRPKHRPKGRGTKASQCEGGRHQSHAHIRMNGEAAHQLGGHGIHGLEPTDSLGQWGPIR